MKSKSTQSELNRIKVIQWLLDRTKTKNYLEIGVNRGSCLLKIRAAVKIAVDPTFKISSFRKFKYRLMNPSNANCIYHEMTSDTFFAEHHELLMKHKPDVVLIDGLHTYDQAYRDVIHSLKFLPEQGVIVMHDCSPGTQSAATPADSIHHARSINVTGAWNGDVWKSIVKLRSAHNDIDICVLDCDHGLGIVRRQEGGKPALAYTEEKIQQMTYQDLDRDRHHLLNLQPKEYFWKMFDKI